MLLVRHTLVTVLLCAFPSLAHTQNAHATKTQAAATAPSATEVLDLNMYSRIRDEGFNHSHVMEYAGALFDDIGPRLTGSPAMTRANEWTRAQLAAMGCSNAHLESWGEFGMAWTQLSASLALVKPSPSVLTAQATPWSPATAAAVTADVVFVHGMKSEAEFAVWKGKLKGKVILYGSSTSDPKVDPDSVPKMEHYDAAKLHEIADYPLNGDMSEQAVLPTDPNLIRPVVQGWAFKEKVGKFFADEGAVAILVPGGSGGVLHDDTGYSMGWFVYRPEHKQLIPEEVVATEAWDRMQRLIDHKVPVTVNLAINTRFGEEHVPGMNTIAEIAGTDPKLKEEVVMVGGHLDSWIGGTGATDNGAGAIVAMEAMRILTALRVQPRRTIRIGL